MKQLNIKFLLALLISMLGVKASAHDIEVKNVDGVSIYYYYVSSTELAVCYRGSNVTLYDNEYMGNVVIPETVIYNGVTYSVTCIGENAFYNCSGLTSITIPNSITSIGNYAFQGCSGLTSIAIGNSVTSIGENAFTRCSGLTSIAIPNSVTNIGRGVFEDCIALMSVVIGNSVTSIGTSAFQGCSGLTSITIGNSVTSIGYYAFQDCNGLTEVHISDLAAWCNIMFNNDHYANPLYYAKHLYLNGEEITELNIPNSVTCIGNSTFEYCSSLTSITIPNSVTSIGDYAFRGCI